MTRGQRLAAAIVGVAAILLVGRCAALVYVDRAWYLAAGAQSVWHAKVEGTVVLYGGALIIGTLFAFLNLFAVRKSIVALIVPTRIGNVEIGERVPSSKLVLITAGMSVCAAVISTFALPSWTTFALWRSNVSFGEFDPYFSVDLGRYVAWMPLENAVYTWAFVVYATVALLVLVLYALTPSLSFGREGIRITAYARRHLSVLAALLVLFIAWQLRIDAFHLLVHASGAGGALTRLDHEWIIPTSLVFSVVTLAAAVVILVTGWMGQTQLAFIAVSAVIVFLICIKIALPLFASRTAANPSESHREAPYVAIRNLYTARAFPAELTPPSVTYAADSALMAAAPKLQLENGLPDIVYPGARGIAIEPDTLQLVQAPRMQGWWSKLMTAWAEQNPHLLSGQLPPTAAVVRYRDVRERVKALAPIFMQSKEIGARMTPVGIVWIIDLYATSTYYPLSVAHRVGHTSITYRHHAATAYVNGVTARTTIVPDSTLDPIAHAWFTRHPGSYLNSHPLVDLQSPPLVKNPRIPANTAIPDIRLRTNLLRIYHRMRSALDSGNFHSFGDAFDSLGTVLGAH